MTYHRPTRCIALAAAMLLAACGGGSDSDENASSGTAPITQVVAFGDSFSDAGTYHVGSIATIGAQTGGAGRFTVNGTQEGPLWVEQLTARLGLPAGCAAETGLLPNAPQLSGAPITAHPGCTLYAQGAARVISDQADQSVALQSQGQVNIGYLAKPVQRQMAAHLAAAGGRYSGNELVTVLAGTNDIFMALAAPAPWDAAQALARAAAAGQQLGELIRTDVLAHGAQRVLVLNLPDLAGTPYGRERAAQIRQALQAQGVSDGTDPLALMDAMTRAFNAQLAQALQDAPEVRVADTYGLFQSMLSEPARHGLSHVSDVACGPNAFSPSVSTNGPAVLCNASNLLPGERSRYLFADGVHPTPYAHGLLADWALAQLRQAGWWP